MQFKKFHSSRFDGFLLFIILLLLAVPSVYQSMTRNIKYLQLPRLAVDSPFICAVEPGVCVSKDQSIILDGTELKDAYLISQSPGDLNERGVLILPLKDKGLLWFAWGALALQSGQVDEAVDLWANEPDIATYLMNVSQNIDDPQRAIELLQLALQVQAGAPVYQELGARLDQAGKGTQALQAYNWALDAARTDQDANLQAIILMQIGELSLRQGDLTGASASYEDAKELLGELPALAAVRLAKTYAKLGYLDQANEILRALLQQRPDIAPAWWWLGEVERKRGNTQAALEAYHIYLRMEPDDKVVQKRIRELEQ